MLHLLRSVMVITPWQCIGFRQANEHDFLLRIGCVSAIIVVGGLETLLLFVIMISCYISFYLPSDVVTTI